jgi:hypothetical protein
MQLEAYDRVHHLEHAVALGVELNVEKDRRLERELASALQLSTCSTSLECIQKPLLG